MNLYLVELIEYYYDAYTETINQDEAKILGVYQSEEEARKRVEFEIENYKNASKTKFDVLRDEVLQENCIEALDVISETGRVTLIATQVLTGPSEVKIDYNRINYFKDYDRN
ncbi:MAG: DUF7336 domain-containing protein [Sarcina sp.]